MTFKIEYSNDTGLDDEGFWEWWEVRGPGDEVVCKCDDQAWAEKICKLLNSEEQGTANASL